ncbi:hypothetical protein [Nocardioides sp. TF02-7]|uniref:hypothetical protein n=1 Tax=Nocardioides sp. TF02-7 TaxID=2917724 RepID=UPI001F0667E5|nr:hypothetical protein [Nocardioides sp. TF02-7]UMG93765.1 hypothetical protein MF408_06305 [Nocardioides sp. TF02-7]
MNRSPPISFVRPAQTFTAGAWAACRTVIRAVPRSVGRTLSVNAGSAGAPDGRSAASRV